MIIIFWLLFSLQSNNNQSFNNPFVSNNQPFNNQIFNDQSISNQFTNQFTNQIIEQTSQTETQSNFFFDFIFNIKNAFFTGRNMTHDYLNLQNQIIQKIPEAAQSPPFWDLIGQFSPSFFKYFQEWDTFIYKKYEERGVWAISQGLPSISFIFDFRLFPLLCGLLIFYRFIRKKTNRKKQIPVFFFFFFIKVLSMLILPLFASDLFFTCSSLFLGSVVLHLYIFLIEIAMFVGFYIYLRRENYRIGVSPSESIDSSIKFIYSIFDLKSHCPNLQRFAINFQPKSLYGIITFFIPTLFAFIVYLFPAVGLGLRYFFLFISNYIGPFYNLFFSSSFYPVVDFWDSMFFTPLLNFVLTESGLNNIFIFNSILSGLIRANVMMYVFRLKFQLIFKVLEFLKKVLIHSFTFRIDRPKVRVYF